ncbi:prephenate/arogenate dehydrogenase family protein [Sphingomonas daechungensis]|uniref:prephenate/arogenate dehydrogenase family protein n=1 Tax=Sphingomonas daechungensis TaxID=1176646 RepID=UPI0031EFE41A
MTSISPPFQSVTVIGLGLIGSSIARSVREAMPGVRLNGFDVSADVCDRAASLQLVDLLAEGSEAAVSGADLVILCVPVGAMAEAAISIAPHLRPGTIVTDVGSAKGLIAREIRAALPDAVVIPAHPIAGTENSGPEAGFAGLFRNRWCILTPEDSTDPADIARLVSFWDALGARVEIMDAARHDLVLAITSHLPHLIAFTIVGTASHLEAVTEGEVIKYSAGGFRDFTRIAASNPVMWRDVFLANQEAVLDVLGRFLADLGSLENAIREADGPALFDWFSRTGAIRRAIIYEGQDVAAPDFGRQKQ